MKSLRDESGAHSGSKLNPVTFVGLLALAYVSGLVLGFVGLAAGLVGQTYENKDRTEVLVFMAIYTFGGFPGAITATAFVILYYATNKVRWAENVVHQSFLRLTWMAALLLSIGSTYALATAIAAPVLYVRLICTLVAVCIGSVVLATAKGLQLLALFFAILPFLAWPAILYMHWYL